MVEDPDKRILGRQLFIGKGRGVVVVAAVVVAASVIVTFTFVSDDDRAPEGTASAGGPLVVSSENPRFFTAG